MRTRAAGLRHKGRRIALVPTMGYLHAGHVSLLEEGRRRGDVLVLSIFVNPTQFGPKEDLSRYPQDLDGDLAKAEEAGVDLVFVPEVADMYPAGYQTYVEVKELSRGLCGERRPGHFVGVATVVLKLFHLVRPHVALFGMKDFQQLQVIRRMVVDLDLDIEIVGMPIVREPDGLALSSRNSYLNSDERLRALALSQALKAARVSFEAGQRKAPRLIDAARIYLHMTEGVRLDYLELRDAETLEPIEDRVTRPAVMAIAAFVGNTRLIDNQLLTP
jgi:pantoate--beta-alanine ligase